MKNGTNVHYISLLFIENKIFTVDVERVNRHLVLFHLYKHFGVEYEKIIRQYNNYSKK